MSRMLPPTHVLPSPMRHREGAMRAFRGGAMKVQGWPHVTSVIRLMVWLLSLMVVVPLGNAEPIEPGCDGPYKGKKLDRAQLEALGVLRHDARPNLCGADLSHAELTNANLEGANLTQTNLWGANLTKANLYGADLIQANLEGADLIQANLEGADLIQAHLAYAVLTQAILEGANLTQAELGGANLTQTYSTDANLTEADLSSADLTQAHLGGANLTQTYLGFADLTQANLEGANLTLASLPNASLTDVVLDNSNLTGAKFARADLTGVYYSPKTGTPNISDMAFARNLRLMQPEEESRPMLSELRDAFKKAGFRQAERDMTYLLKGLDEDRAIQEKSFLEFGFNRVAFRWTCDYGASPGRPLWILFWMFVLLSVIYLYALTRSGRGALWAVWSPDRVQQAEGQKDPVRLCFAQPFPPDGDGIQGAKLPAYLAAPRPSPAAPRGLARIRSAVARFFGAWRLALYFSLLSAFHFGWRDLNVGNWIARIQPREYVIRATGWVRVVSGLQSLISVYLIALWALSYFGRPFDN